MRISLEMAQKIVAEHSKIAETAVLPLESCLGGILAEDVMASMSQPPFRRSAMDGYAVRREECAQALRQGTMPFKVVGEIDAGDQAVWEIGSHEAVRIMTGARVPDSTDMVIPQERSDMGEDWVVFHSLPPTNNIAPVGEDFKAGDMIALKGQKADACLLACAAAAGITKLNVYESPRIGVISTGNELCPEGEPLRPGQIYDSSRIYLVSRLKQFGCGISGTAHGRDDPGEIAGKIEKAVSGADMVITTGGVSVGKRDYLEQAVRSLGGEILFHGIDIKPGMPTMFSMVCGVPVLSLSGNPYSAAAVFEWLFPFRSGIYTEGILHREYGKKRPMPRIVRGRYEHGRVDLAVNQKNGVMQSGIGMNCLALLPEGEEAVAAGTRVLLLLL